MRPKKVVLCVDADEDDLSVRKVLLETHGYRVIAAASADAAVSAFMARAVDLTVVRHRPLELDGAELTRALKRMAPHLPVILLVDPEFLPAVSGNIGDAMAVAACSPLGLLERVRVMSARKRGPRKGQQRASPAAIGTEAK